MTATAEIIKPAGLSDRASLEWDALAERVKESNVTLLPVHRDALLIAATVAADIHDCWTVLKSNGGNYCTAGTGAVKLHPAAGRLDVLRRDWIKALAQLGLTKPVAGEKIDPGDAGSEFFKEYPS